MQETGLLKGLLRSCVKMSGAPRFDWSPVTSSQINDKNGEM